LVSGVHCAACIQKIESRLNKDQNVENARLNLSTGKLLLNWKGTADRANTLIEEVKNLGYSVSPYDEETEKSKSNQQERFLLLCIGISGFAAGNIMLLSVGLWSTSQETMGMATRNLMHWISAIIALPAVMYCGQVFFTSALKALKNYKTNMDVPISLALLLACSMSLYETIHHGEHVYFDSAVMLMFFLLIGRYFDFKAKKNARSAASDLLSEIHSFVTIIENGKSSRIATKNLKENMIIQVAPGEKLPADGIIIEGLSEVDSALITGETIPKTYTKDDLIYAGMLNLSSPIKIKVTKPPEGSVLSEIIKLMDHAKQSQALYVRLADKAAKLYTPIVHLFALLAFCWWFFYMGASWQGSLLIAITVLIITCPCALVLAVPIVQVLSIGKLMKEGILVKSGDALERLATIDTVLFDKTGVLTRGVPELDGKYNKQKLQLAASLAVHSKHPLSTALCNINKEELLALENVKEIPGKGVSATYRNKQVRMGSKNWLNIEEKTKTDKPELWLQEENHPPCPFYFSDPLRDDAPLVINSLNNANIKTFILSGDHKRAVENIAKQLDIKSYKAEQSPVDKFHYLESLKEEGKTVLMVGDGLNDAPVLAKADISMAPGTAVDLAQNAADIVFMGDRLYPVYESYKLACKSQQLVKQNFALAIIYNLIAVPLAFAGMVTPLIAAIAMSGSSLLVIANSFRLKLAQ
jgi:Cu2+-exporting ATPase